MKKQTNPSDSKAATKKADAAAPNNKKFYISGGRTLFLKYGPIAWNNYLKHQPAFASLSSKFTVKLAEDELAGLKKLDKMVQGNSLSDLRLDLLEDSEALAMFFRSSKWNIEEAFPNDDKKLKEAGLLDYQYGNKLSREKTVSIVHTLKSFLTKYKKELAANDNMPDDFVKSFNDTSSRYLKSLQKVIHAESNSNSTTKEIDAAIEAHYTTMIKMLGAATEVLFYRDREVRYSFLLSTLRQQARVANKTCLIGFVRVEGSKKGVANAVVSIQNHPLLTATSNRKGRFEFELEKGSYNLKVKAPGYHVFSITKVVEVGVKNMVAVNLIPLTPVKIAQPEQRPVVAKRQKAGTNGVKV